jgi:hypothetical protein
MKISLVCQGQNYRTILGKGDIPIYGYRFNCLASLMVIPVITGKKSYVCQTKNTSGL